MCDRRWAAAAALLLVSLNGRSFLGLSVPTLAAQSAAQSTAQHRQHVPPAPPSGLTDRIEALHVEGLHPHEALMDLARKANVFIGYEGEFRKTDGKLAFDFPGGSVSDLLNAFIAQAPDFRWETDGPIIHVHRNGGHVSLADVTLNYPGATNKSRFDIWRNLHNLPEYRAWMDANRCRNVEQPAPRNFMMFGGPPVVTIEPGQLTISQLLDQVTLKSAHYSWSIVQASADDSGHACRIWLNAW
jgi:hypothetical protein